MSMMKDKQVNTSDTSAKTLFMFGYDITNRPSKEELAAYCEFLNSSTSVLNEFGIHIGTNGYSYLIEAFKIVIDRERYDVRMKSDIYPLIAVKHGLRRFDPIEHSIRNAINSAYEDNLKNPGCNRMWIFPKKPTNKNFIIYAADEVYKKMCRSMINSVS
jgi:hypothetical protein